MIILSTRSSFCSLVVNLWLVATLALLCAPCWCANAGPIVITIPDGFDGPTRSNSAGGVTMGWVKQQPGSDGGTLLQVSAIDVGTSLEGITPAQHIEATQHYLLEFIKGAKEHVDDFKFGDIDQTNLAGLPAARVHWTGTINGRATIGVMYCVLVHQFVVSLQTQNLGSEISPAMYTAIGAIEGISVR
jgi:hypothetical protein